MNLNGLNTSNIRIHLGVGGIFGGLPTFQLSVDWSHLNRNE
jgi:hypothetical protein